MLVPTGVSEEDAGLLVKMKNVHAKTDKGMFFTFDYRFLNHMKRLEVAGLVSLEQSKTEPSVTRAFYTKLGKQVVGLEPIATPKVPKTTKSKPVDFGIGDKVTFTHAGKYKYTGVVLSVYTKPRLGIFVDIACTDGVQRISRPGLITKI